jgi:hypothetical protein
MTLAEAAAQGAPGVFVGLGAACSTRMASHVVWCGRALLCGSGPFRHGHHCVQLTVVVDGVPLFGSW